MTTVHTRLTSTTRRTLLRLRAGLLIATVLVFATTLLAFQRVHSAAETVRTRAAPVILELTVARAALVKADRAAITSFGTGESGLAGPGDEHQNQLAIASQNLTQVAEDNLAGAAGSGTLQLVQGLLVAYTSLIGQAVAHFRSGDSNLGTADVWYASRLLHTEGSGILAQLDQLLAAQKQALDERVSSRWAGPLISVAWIGSTTVLFGLLVAGQVFLRRRFRRRVNPWLVLASAALVALAVVTSLSFLAQSRLDGARSTLYRVVDDWHAQTATIDAAGQEALGTLVRNNCGAGCGDTVADFVAGLEPTSTPVVEVDDSRLTVSTRTVNEQAAAAGDNAGLQLLIYLLATLIAGCVLIGLYARVDEYRYRPR